MAVVRLLCDENLSPRLAAALRDHGHDAVHVYDVGLGAASGPQIASYAQTESRAVVTEDTDFGALLAHSGGRYPSVIRLAELHHLTPQQQADRRAESLADTTDALTAGAIVTVTERRVRVTRLPLQT